MIKKVTLYKFGFTLAEILIVIGIIGIVAEMTIPSLVASYQKTVYVTSLKKAYVTMNAALNKIALDYGCTGDLACTGLFASTGTNNTTLGTELVKQFKVAKNCDVQMNQHCFPSLTMDGYTGNPADGSGNHDGAAFYKFVTTDGIAYGIANFSNDCGATNPDNVTSNGVTGQMARTCGSVLIDTNSTKKPNYGGRDTFQFYITNAKGIGLYPWGGADFGLSGTSFYWKVHSGCMPGNPVGAWCPGRVIDEGWEMNY